MTSKAYPGELQKKRKKEKNNNKKKKHLYTGGEKSVRVWVAVGKQRREEREEGRDFATGWRGSVTPRAALRGRDRAAGRPRSLAAIRSEVA